MPRRHRNSAPLTAHSKNRRVLYIFVVILLGIIVVTSVIGAFKKTLFFAKKDRVNIVIYGKNTTYFSLGIHTDGNYAVSFPSDLKMDIPGGYGKYRVGALGKLVSLEKSPQILQNTFSLATYSFTDYYFYSKSDDVYYGNNDKIVLPSIKTLWSASSNAHLLDRIYLIFTFLNKKNNDFHELSVDSEKNKDGDYVLDASTFQKSVTGYLFQQSYRNEAKTVQIMYSESYTNADRVAKMIEGNGIKVGDVSQNGSFVRGCVIQENSSQESLTSQALVDTFHCRWEKAPTNFYDILFLLGEKEKEWETK